MNYRNRDVIKGYELLNFLVKLALRALERNWLSEPKQIIAPLFQLALSDAKNDHLLPEGCLDLSIRLLRHIKRHGLILLHSFLLEGV